MNNEDEYEFDKSSCLLSLLLGNVVYPVLHAYRIIKSVVKDVPRAARATTTVQVPVDMSYTMEIGFILITVLFVINCSPAKVRMKSRRPFRVECFTHSS